MAVAPLVALLARHPVAVMEGLVARHPVAVAPLVALVARHPVAVMEGLMPPPLRLPLLAAPPQLPRARLAGATR